MQTSLRDQLWISDFLKAALTGTLQNMATPQRESINTNYYLLLLNYSSQRTTDTTSLLLVPDTTLFVSVVTCTCGRDWWDGMPEVYDSQEKKQFISCVEVFDSESGDWICQPTSQQVELLHWE